MPVTIHQEAEWLRNFSCKTAHCFKPIDRATVLNFIRQEWGSEQAFDEFVHTHLLKVLERSKREYASQLLRVAGESFEMVFSA